MERKGMHSKITSNITTKISKHTFDIRDSFTVDSQQSNGNMGGIPDPERKEDWIRRCWLLYLFEEV